MNKNWPARFHLRGSQRDQGRLIPGQPQFPPFLSWRRARQLGRCCGKTTPSAGGPQLLTWPHAMSHMGNFGDRDRQPHFKLLKA